jgi:hypothetical protein
MENNLKAIAITDEVETCECCGRTGLKRTVLLSNGSHFGTDCAAAALYGSKKFSNRVRKDADAAMRMAQEITRTQSDIARYTELIEAGHVRIPIGKVLGAEIAPILEQSKRRLAMLVAA